MKPCKYCREVKEFSEFTPNKRCKNGVTNRCRVCQNAYNKTVKDPDYRSPNANENNRRYYQANKSKIKEYHQSYKEANRHKYAHYQKMRHTTQLQATPPWLSETQVKEIELFYMIAKWYDEPMHVDHIVPLQGKNVCGLHVPWNLRVIPVTENLKKGNKLEAHTA